MAKQRFFPQSEKTIQTGPDSCFCGSTDFKRISEKTRERTRYMCNKCRGSYFDNSKKDEKNLEKIGNVFDNITYGMSSRETALKMFIDWGEMVSHGSILGWSNTYNRYAKMFTDDILCCLDYGTSWGIDETIIDIRGSYGPGDERFAREIDQLRTTTKNDKEYKKEYEKLRAKQVRSERTANKIYLTGIIDLKTRVIIHYIITDKRPVHSQIYKLLKIATTVAGIPTIVTTDCYPAYPKAIKRWKESLPSGNIEHIQNKAGNQSTLHISAGKTAQGNPRHNNVIESTWSKLKRNMDVLGSYENHYEHIIGYNILRYNFIRPHSGLGKITVERHGKTNTINMTPAMAGGYPIWFANFSELFKEAWGYDKSFVFKVGPDLMSNLKVGVRKKEVVISVKPNVPDDTIKKIDRILQVMCGFAKDSGKEQWRRQIDSIMNMRRRRTAKLGLVPEQTFEVCNRCGVQAVTSQEISDIIGYRKTGEKIITQPNCHKCRAELSANPKNPTGKNKKSIKKGQKRLF